MNIDEVNLCMQVLESFEEDARQVFDCIVNENPVIEDGPWGKVSWWNGVVARYRNDESSLACAGGALAAAAEFMGRNNDIPIEVYLRAWVLMAPSVKAMEVFNWMGTLGGKYIPSMRSYFDPGNKAIYDDCFTGKMTVRNALGLIEALEDDNPAQETLMNYVAVQDERLLSLAFYLRTNGGSVYGLSAVL